MALHGRTMAMPWPWPPQKIRKASTCAALLWLWPPRKRRTSLGSMVLNDRAVAMPWPWPPREGVAVGCRGGEVDADVVASKISFERPPPGGVVAQPCVAVLWPRSPWKGRTMFAPTAWHGRAVTMPWPYPPRKFRNAATSGAGLGQFLGRAGPLSWLGWERNTGPREDTSGGPRSLSTNPPPPL